MTLYLKYSDNPNLLHIYEHVVSIRLHEKLQQEGYFPYVDYALKAITHDSGYSSMSLEIYNNELRGVDLKYLNQITFSDEDISKAYLQVIAEEGVTFRLVSPEDNLKDEISKLHASSWTEELIDVDYDSRQMISDKTLLEDDSIVVDEYKMELNFDGVGLQSSVQEDVFSAIGHTLQVYLSNRRGYYRETMELRKAGIAIGFKVPRFIASEIDMEDDLKVSKQIISQLLHSQSFESLFSKKLEHQELSGIIESIEKSIENWSPTNCTIVSSKTNLD